MINESELLSLLADLESFNVERTTSTKDMAKFCEAICAFANDMHASGKPGFLLIGADDKTGAPTGLQATDELLRNLSGLTSDGNILPPPAVTVYTVPLSSGAGDVVVVEVQPSELPPVRYKGLIHIRRGPRKAVANESEEKLLIERRMANLVTFDAHPCRGASLSDLSIELFTDGYRPKAVDAEVIAANHRPIEQQLASLRFWDLKRNYPTNAGILLLGKDPLYWFPNAYVQYVKFDGDDMGASIAAEKRFMGNFFYMVRNLDDFTEVVVTKYPKSISVLQEEMVYDYPRGAVRELLMNAVLHCDYDSPSPIRFFQYSNRMEIMNSGPLYGRATPENFPRETGYRNPILAEALKTLGYVNRFGYGVAHAKNLLERNGNPPAEFEFGNTYFKVVIYKRK